MPCSLAASDVRRIMIVVPCIPLWAWNRAGENELCLSGDCCREYVPQPTELYPRTSWR
jgi:hypothetical protein